MSIGAARRAQTWGIGTVWAAAMLLLAVVMPRPGGWTIDDGVKRIAAEHGTGVWAEKIMDGPVRSALTDPGDFAPLVPPFAYRVRDGFALGFSPVTRAFTKALGRNEILIRVAIALPVILLWVLMERAGYPYAFLLLPLTFYGLVPWEHGLSWLLLWPAIWASISRQRPGNGFFILGGALTALAVLVRPDTLVMAAALGVLILVRRNYRGLTAYAAAGLAVAGCITALHAATAQEPMWVQLSLNQKGPFGVLSWIRHLPVSAWVLLIMMDRNVWLSTFMTMVLLTAALLLDIDDRRESPAAKMAGWALAVGWLSVYQYRLWTHPFPPMIIGWSNSLLATLPWVIVLARPPYRGRHALCVAAAVMAAVIVTTPSWMGVHWGPRVMLFSMPLLAVDLYQTGRARGTLFTTMMALTVVLMLTSVALVYTRNQELAEGNHIAKRLLGPVVITPSTGNPGDFVPLWKGREFFTVANERKLRELLMEFQRIHVDTCWLHASLLDPILQNAFPSGRPVEIAKDTEFVAGIAYQRAWRITELALRPGDTSWASVLQAEAGTLMNEGRAERALEIQREAVELTPNSAQVHHNLALIYSKLGETTEARAEVQRALEIDSTLTEARLLSADLSRRTGGIPTNGERRPDRDPARRPD